MRRHPYFKTSLFGLAFSLCAWMIFGSGPGTAENQRISVADEAPGIPIPDDPFSMTYHCTGAEVETKTISCGPPPEGHRTSPVPPPPPKPEVEEIFSVVERMPLFPGCDGAGSYPEKKACADRKLLEFVYGNITYPPEAITAGVEGTAVITFVVEKDGRVSEPKIVRDPGAGTGAEALRVVNLINAKGLKFDPQSSSGRPVRVQFNLPVKFKLE